VEYSSFLLTPAFRKAFRQEIGAVFFNLSFINTLEKTPVSPFVATSIHNSLPQERKCDSLGKKYAPYRKLAHLQFSMNYPRA
jgi:hypothetical protein